MIQNETSELQKWIKPLLGELDPVPTEVEPRLAPLPGVRAVLFDVYGTLLVSGSGDVGSAQEAAAGESLGKSLASVGLAEDPTAAGELGSELLLPAIQATHAIKRNAGVEYPEVEIRAVWRRVLAELAAENLVESHVRDEDLELMAIEYECRTNPTWTMPGAAEVLGALRERGRSLGIVSNAQFYTRPILELLLGQKLDALGFEEDLCAWSYRVGEAKPSRKIFSRVLRALEKRKISPRQIAYIGNDMRNDIRTASECGLRTVLFAGDQRSLRLRTDDPRCRDCSPDCIVTDLRQILEIVPAGSG